MAADNPYESPTNEGDAPTPVTNQRSGKPGFGLVATTCLLLAVVAGVACWLAFYDANLAMAYAAVPLVFGLPALAVIIASGMSVYWFGKRTVLASAWRWLGKILLVLVVAAAGWIAFAATCCCTNAAMSGTSYSPPPVLGGVVAAISVLLGCGVAYGIHNAIHGMLQKRRSAD